MKFTATSITLIFLVCLISSTRAFSLEFGCTLHPSNLNSVGSNLVAMYHQSKSPLPDNIPLPVDVDIDFSSDSNSTLFNSNITSEAFYRPSENDFFSMANYIPLFPNVPLLGFDIDKERLVLYVCAHHDVNPEKTHVTVYFMRGYNMDPFTWTNFLGDLVHKPELKVRPIPVSLFGISTFKKFLINIFKFIPFSETPFDAISFIQSFIANLAGDITGFGVERIEITSTYFKVASGIDLNSPRDAVYKKTFSLKKPKLGDEIESDPR